MVERLFWSIYVDLTVFWGGHFVEVYINQCVTRKFSTFFFFFFFLMPFGFVSRGINRSLNISNFWWFVTPLGFWNCNYYLCFFEWNLFGLSDRSRRWKRGFICKPGSTEESETEVAWNCCLQLLARIRVFLIDFFKNWNSQKFEPYKNHSIFILAMVGFPEISYLVASLSGTRTLLNIVYGPIKFLGLARKPRFHSTW